MSNPAKPAIAQPCSDFRISPGGELVWSTTSVLVFCCFSPLSVCCCFLVSLSAMLVRPFKIQLVFADSEIAFVQNLGHDVHAIFQVEVDQVGCSVFELVQRGFLLRR